MFSLNVNIKLLPLKICFFLLFSCYAPIVGFLPSITRQLGYSLTTYGALMMVISLSLMILTLIFSIIVDKFRVKKKLFTTFLVGIVVVSFFFIFVPKVPLKAIVELKCYSETAITPYYTGNNPQIPDGNSTVIRGRNNDKLITCKLDCEERVIYGEKTALCEDWTESATYDKYKHIDVTWNLNDTNIVDNSYVFRLSSVQFRDTDERLATTCRCPVKTACRIDCNDDAVMEAITEKTYRGNVLDLYQFWIFFTLLFSILSFTCLSGIFINPICLDILDEKSVDYGKQKLWGSIGWGISSIVVGWIVDLYSYGKKNKDYTPVFASCIILTVVNLIVITKIKVVEITKSNCVTCHTVVGLFTKHYVIVFIIWSTICTFFHGIITHYLFWYMEDMVTAGGFHSELIWLKTIQGIAQGVQCFGGEIPFLFWSGWIIKRLGNANCMALVLGAMAIRMYLYTVISNPIWIVLIELLNGVSYALGFALKMSCLKKLAPPGTLNRVVGCIAFFDCIGDSFASYLGGRVFDLYGGVLAFRIFAYTSALACGVNVVADYFGLIKNFVGVVNDENDEKKSTKTNANSLAGTSPTDVDL